MNVNEGTKSKTGRMDILQTVLEEMQVNDAKQAFVKVLEKICLTTSSGVKDKRLLLQNDVILTVLDIILDNTPEYSKTILQEFKHIFMPDELKRLTVKHNSLQQFDQFAHGGFGVVHVGLLTKPDGSVQKVAIKIPKQGIHKNMLLQEAKIMAQLDHGNIVKLVAFQKDPLKIVMEYMEWQNIEIAMQKNMHAFDRVDILKALKDAASGMEYLSEKKIVHRDLACRNIFVNSSKVCKIGDFGLAIYEGHRRDCFKENGGSLLMYNVAPEAMETQKFSTKTDVWAFGILIWELYDIVQKPFNPVRGFTIKQVMSQYYFTNTLPYNAMPMDLYNYVLNNLMNRNPTKRPDFTAIKKFISDLIVSPPKYRQGSVDGSILNSFMDFMHFLDLLDTDRRSTSSSSDSD